MQDKIFADGFLFKRKENAPDFVVGRLSMKVDEAVAFLKKHEKNGWVNLDIKNGRSGNPYIELDTYEPKQREEQEASRPAKKQSRASTPPPQDTGDDDLPF